MKPKSPEPITTSVELPFNPHNDLVRSISRFMEESPNYLVTMNGKTYISLLALVNFIAIVIIQKQLPIDYSLTIGNENLAHKLRSVAFLKRLWADLKLEFFILRDDSTIEIWLDCAEEDANGFHFQKLRESLKFPSDSSNLANVEQMLRFLKFKNLHLAYITIENQKV